MIRFYICTTGIPKGPYKLSEIDKLDIDANDLVWIGDYHETLPAIQLPEFRNYFKKKQAFNTNSHNKPEYYKPIVLAFLLSILAALVGYYFIVAN